LTDSDLSNQKETDDKIQADCMETANILSEHDQWILLDAPRCSEEELQRELAHYGLENDLQTARFCKFVSLATNFASLRFVERIQRLPELIDTIKQLLAEIEREIHEMADMGSFFEELVYCFTSLVLTTQHNMKMMLPHLNNARDYMNITIDALGSNTDQPLSEEDRSDINTALQGMCSGIEHLLKLSQSSRERSEKINQEIETLKQTVQSKRIVVEGRIDFGEHFKIISQAISAVGVYRASNALTLSNIPYLDRFPSLIQVGSRIYPPLRPILIGFAIGGITLATISMLVKRFWLKQNYRALEILGTILEHLMRLSQANNHFTMYMRNSEASANDVLVNIRTLQQQITSPSARIRKMNRNVCERASKATTEMIDSIEKVLVIDLSQWTSYSTQHRIVIDQTRSISNLQTTAALTYDCD
jgi:hypothetical protein